MCMLMNAGLIHLMFLGGKTKHNNEFFVWYNASILSSPRKQRKLFLILGLAGRHINRWQSAVTVQRM